MRIFTPNKKKHTNTNANTTEQTLMSVSTTVSTRSQRPGNYWRNAGGVSEFCAAPIGPGGYERRRTSRRRRKSARRILSIEIRKEGQLKERRKKEEDDGQEQEVEIARMGFTTIGIKKKILLSNHPGTQKLETLFSLKHASFLILLSPHLRQPRISTSFLTVEILHFIKSRSNIDRRSLPCHMETI